MAAPSRTASSIGTPRRAIYIGAFLEPELRRRLEAAARASDRSLSAEIRLALRARYGLGPARGEAA